jgi:aconitate decarboxylase
MMQNKKGDQARPSGITERLCRTITGIGFGSLPPEAVEVAKRVMLDGIAVGIAGAIEEGPRIATAHIQSLGGGGDSAVLGMGIRANPVAAALVNGISIHVLDFEPMWMPPTHAVSPALPSVLAAAGIKKADGRETLAAFIKACEIQGRLNLAGKLYAPALLVHHPPGYLGVMGAAVGAGHLLGLNAGQLSNALGIAASRAGSLIGNIGTMTKATHCGYSASLGLEAAMLAARGFTGNPSVIEAENGYRDAFFLEEFDYDALLAFGQPYRMVDPGFAIKQFPSQYPSHFVITAALELHSRVSDPSEIASVKITGPVMNYVNRPAPQTGLEGKFSFQYAATAALLDGEVGIGTFKDSRVQKSDVQELLGKTTFVQSDDIPKDMDKMYVEISVTLKNGDSAAARCDGPKDFWGAPKLSRDEHMKKIRDCLRLRLDEPAAERLIELCASLENLSPAGVEEITDIAGCFENRETGRELSS